ncbi:hypothetical protein BDZ91DRAFT_774020 [Kalaharituber pfeilii]|nr:hypothetical protein BDZ91DRAFT_774020 [Kalaharituber pfeilii]
MDKILDSLLSLSSKPLQDEAYDRQMSSLVQALNKIGAANMITTPGGPSLLEVLDPTEQSVGYLYILVANIRLIGIDHGDIWKRTVLFLESYDSRQISYALDQFKALVGEIVRFTSEIDKPLLIVRPLKKAILRSAKPTRFSFLHTCFVQKCLEARCYRDACTILDMDVTEFPSRKEAKDIGYQDVVSYFLYGGMIYIGLKNWRRAMDYLTYAVAYPGNACSSIQLEAYKKYLLVGLLLEGKTVNIPPGTSSNAVRAYRALVKPYESFTAAFNAGDAEGLRQQTITCMPIFVDDGNAGLATQCLDAFRRFQIAGLTHTYVTLSVKEIARRNLELLGRGGGEDETERYVLGMIERDEIRASLSHESPSLQNSGCVIHFHDNPQSEKRNLRGLEEQIMRTVAITNQAKTLEKKLGLSKEYISYLNKLGKSGSAGGAGGGNLADPDSMDTGDMFDYLARSSTGYSFDDMVDEDIMHQDSFDDE